MGMQKRYRLMKSIATNKSFLRALYKAKKSDQAKQVLEHASLDQERLLARLAKAIAQGKIPVSSHQEAAKLSEEDRKHLKSLLSSALVTSWPSKATRRSFLVKLAPFYPVILHELFA